MSGGLRSTAPYLTTREARRRFALDTLDMTPEQAEEYADALVVRATSEWGRWIPEADAQADDALWGRLDALVGLTVGAMKADVVEALEVLMHGRTWRIECFDAEPGEAVRAALATYPVPAHVATAMIGGVEVVALRGEVPSDVWRAFTDMLTATQRAAGVERRALVIGLREGVDIVRLVAEDA